MPEGARRRLPHLLRMGGAGCRLCARGEAEEAKSAVAEALRLNPKLTVKWLSANIWNFPAYVEGLRKAGMPEE